MLDDDNGDSDEQSSMPEVDLLEQLNKMNLQEDATNAVDVGHDEAISRASSKLLLRSNPVFSDHRASSKFRAALQQIKTTILPSDEKVVVVSQWTSVLNLFREHLVTEGIKHVALTGQVPVKFRNDIVIDFNSKTSGTKVSLNQCLIRIK